VVELLKTKCTPILLYGLDACPVNSRQLGPLNHVVGKFLMAIHVKLPRSLLNCVESVTLLTLWPRVKTNLLRDSRRTAV